MNNLNETLKFVDKIKLTLNREFKNELDVLDILYVIYKSEKSQLLEDLAFCAKYTKGLFSIIQNNNNINLNDEYKSKINSDLKESIVKIKEIFKSITENFTKEKKDSFYLRYLAMNQSAFTNLYNLIDDFDLIKIYLNSIKHNEKIS